MKDSKCVRTSDDGGGVGLPSALATPLPIHMRPTNTMRTAIRARRRFKVPESLKVTDLPSSNWAVCDPRSFKLPIPVVISNRNGGVQNGGRSERRFICSLRDLGFLNNAIQSGAQRGSQDRHTQRKPWNVLRRRRVAPSRICQQSAGSHHRCTGRRLQKKRRGGSESRLSASTHPERPAA